MLPDGFEWRPYVDGPALYLAGRRIADISILPSGKVRACTSPYNAAIRYRFFDSEAVAVAYVEAWARKWQDELRRLQP